MLGATVTERPARALRQRKTVPEVHQWISRGHPSIMAMINEALTCHEPNTGLRSVTALPAQDGLGGIIHLFQFRERDNEC